MAKMKMFNKKGHTNKNKAKGLQRTAAQRAGAKKAAAKRRK